MILTKLAERDDSSMPETKKKLIIFTDIGDTVIDEGTEVRNENGDVVSAVCIPGARETYLRLYEEGYTIVMVADGTTPSFHNTMEQHGMDHIFAAWIISDKIGEDKPSLKMFSAAMKALNLTEEDKKRVSVLIEQAANALEAAKRTANILSPTDE